MIYKRYQNDIMIDGQCFVNIVKAVRWGTDACNGEYKAVASRKRNNNGTK